MFFSPVQLIAAILDKLMQRRNDLTGHGRHDSAHLEFLHGYAR
jgi:hypothetical protein